MKRFLIAAAVLFGMTASASYADYVLIRAVLGGKKESTQPGAQGGAPGDDSGPPGAPPGGGRPRGPGGPGTPPPGGGGDGEIPNLNGQGGEIDTNALMVITVVEAKRKTPTPLQRGVNVSTRFSNPKGSTQLYNDGASLQAFVLPALSPRSRFKSRYDAAFKNRTDDKVYDLADWCLTHGLLDEFAKLMDELVTAKEDKATGSSDKLKKAAKAYAEVKETLKKPIDNDASSSFWKSRVQGRMEQSPHFSLIYNAPVADPPEVKERLALLEEHMRGFYYWFALHGIALPLPKEKMVAVLIDSPDEFRKQRSGIDDEPLVVDGFYAPRDNVIVLSKERIDAPFQAYARQTQTLWTQGFDKQGLLDGTAKRKVTVTPNDWAKYQTMALLEKGLELEADRAAISHEGSRQLLVSSGLVPRNIALPQWVSFGSAAFFETPKGPFQKSKLESSVPWYSGYGSPSWAYLRGFREMETSNKLGDPVKLLESVVTDGEFNAVVGSKDQQGLYKARATSWALAYYLMRTRLSSMARYMQELSSLPRDLEIDPKTLLACFARAFDCANATQDGVDPAKFGELAKNWLAYMKGVAAPGAEYGLDQAVAPPGGPNDPMGPGGPGTPAGPGGPGRGGPPGKNGPGGGGARPPGAG